MKLCVSLLLLIVKKICYRKRYTDTPTHGQGPKPECTVPPSLIVHFIQTLGHIQ